MPHANTAILAAAIAAPAILAATHTSAQETTNTPAATLPGVGRVQIKQSLRLESFDPDREGRTVTDTTLTTSVVIGVARELAVLAELPVRSQDADAPAMPDNNSGFTDAHIGMRYRFIRKDLGPLDTLRVALDARLQLPTGNDSFTSDSVNPDVSINANYIRERHGFNASLGWLFTTGARDTPRRAGDTLADRATLNTAYAFRINPEEYNETTTGATYLQLELLTNAETNGDTEAAIAPGLLYEGQRFAAEASLILPVHADTSERPSSRGSFVIGARFLF